MSPVPQYRTWSKCCALSAVGIRWTAQEDTGYLCALCVSTGLFSPPTPCPWLDAQCTQLTTLVASTCALYQLLFCICCKHYFSLHFSTWWFENQVYRGPCLWQDEASKFSYLWMNLSILKWLLFQNWQHTTLPKTKHSIIWGMTVVSHCTWRVWVVPVIGNTPQNRVNT